MAKLSRIKLPFLLVTLTFFAIGCATQVTEQPSKVTRATTNLGEYDRVILVKAKIAPDYAEHPANIKAVNKIDEILALRVPEILNNVEVKTVEELASLNPNSKVLLIKPYVKQVKFVGGAARFWAGAMAGSSVVIMDTTFEEGQTGKILSNPGFMRKAGAYTDAFGTASNAMLSDIAQDVANYIASNK